MASRFLRTHRPGWNNVWLTLQTAAICAMASSVAAQGRDTVPTTPYFLTFADYYEGRYGDALKGFNSEGRGGIKGITGRWIDSICYHTMAGECHYQVGRYPEALEQYTAALQLYLKHNDWMIRVNAVAIKPAGLGQVKTCPWGRSTRNPRIGEVPDTMMVAQGQIDNRQVLQRGGVVQPATLIALQGNEIVRCTALALRRRRELLGPAGPYDTLNAELVAALARRPITPNDWKEAWIDIKLALAYSCVGNDGQAKGLLQRGLVAGGEFDHPLTATALFELGRIAFSQGELEAASRSFEEASYSAFQYDDPQLVEEALRYGQLTHMLANAKQPYPPLEAAANFARTKKLTALQVSCMLSAADGMANLGRTPEALELLSAARTTMGNRDMLRGKLGARMNYLLAVAQYQQGKTRAGDEALAPALAFQRSGGSLWLHHMGLVDKLHTNGTVSDRVAMNLYDNVLRDPQPADWTTDPLECLSVLTTPHPLPFEHWFETALERKEYERALEISDLLRRHRFLSALPFGGRLLALEWMMEGPDDLLHQEAKLQRQTLLARHPLYHELAQQVRQVRAELEQLPLVPDEPAQQKQQAEKLARLAELSAKQEVLLREVAVRREPCNLIFPPRRTMKEIQAELGENRALLAFLATSKQLYAFLITNDSYPIWEIGATTALRKQIESMLRGMGNFESNHVVSFAELKGNAWAEPAEKIREALFKGHKAPFPGKIEELVVVPDTFLWYLPFEALPVGDGRKPQTLISKTRLRYTPTIALAVPDSRGRKTSAATAVVAGKMYPGVSESVSATACEELRQAMRGTVALRTPLPAASSVYSSIFDRLIVLDELGLATDANPFGCSPVTLDKGNQGSTLEAWMGLPWNAPDQVILPAFRTPAENSLKKVVSSQAGSELFYASCALMASGSRTVLLSRWRTGGQSSIDLTREFLQELPHAPAAAAWQRSVFLSFDSPVIVEQEPRLKAGANDEPLSASHPFFWAGYMLLDSGAPPFKSDEPEPRRIELKPGAAELKAEAAPAKPGEAALKQEKPGE